MFESAPAPVDPGFAPPVLSDGELVSRADAVWASLGAAHHEMLAFLAEIDRREAWRDDGAEDVGHWASIRYGLSMWKAARWVEAARSLPDLPLTTDALRSGRLGIDHVVELCRFATPGTERRLIAWAAERSSGSVRRRADLERRRSKAEVLEAERDRWLHTWYTADGTRFGLEAQLTADEGAVVERALGRLAEKVPDTPDDRIDERGRAPLEFRRADALVRLCSGRLASDPDHDRAAVVVHVSARTLLGDEEVDAAPASGVRNAEIEDGPVLAPPTARRLACDARLQLSVEDATGTPIALGRLRRTPSAAMIRALRRRDRTCRFPRCSARRYTDAHHIVWWSRGGQTDLRNLVLLCGFHHRLVHEGGWRLTLNSDASVGWVRPNGERYRSGPAPPRSESL
jgi:hypothetical protein